MLFLLQLGNCHEVLTVSDVGFILDVSGSITDEYWEEEKTFVKNLTREFDILPHGARVSIVTFNDDAVLAIMFSDHKTNADFETALSKIDRRGYGGTNIGAGLAKALDDMFQVKNGMRPASPHVAVLITDGKNGNKKFATFRNRFQGNEIKILAVGVGAFVDDELRRLVGLVDKDFLSVKDFSKLNINDFIKNTTFCKYKLR